MSCSPSSTASSRMLIISHDVTTKSTWSLLNWSWVTRLQGRMDSSSTCLVLGLTITQDGWAKPSMYWRWFSCNTSFLIYTGRPRRRWRRWRSLWCLSIWGRGSLLRGSPQLHRMIFYSAKVLLSTRKSILVCPARLWQSSTDTPSILQKIWSPCPSSTKIYPWRTEPSWQHRYITSPLQLI